MRVSDPGRGGAVALSRRGARRGAHSSSGGALQVDAIKPTLKPPGVNHLKLESVILLSTVAFNFNLRRYVEAAGPEFGPMFLRVMVGRCRLPQD